MPDDIMDRSLVLKADIAHVLEYLAGTDVGCNDGAGWGEGSCQPMKQMGQEARLNYIVEELKKDSGSLRDMEVRPRDRRRVMRSLMNIRMPGPLPAGFLEIQDEFLREEAQGKGDCGSV